MITKNDILSTTTPSQSYFLEKKRPENKAMAASAVSELIRIRKKTIRESFQCIQNDEYRLDRVVKIQGVSYVNDSGAVTLNATYYSLETMKTPVVWITGGDDAAVQYDQLLPLVNEKVVAIIGIGVLNKKLISHFDNCVDFILEAQTMQDAVQKAQHLAEKGDTVLLSPACLGLDRYENFKDRGKQFIAAVRSL